MTDNKEESELENLAKAVNDSGFPLQLGIQRIAARNRRWKVELVEHAWTDPVTKGEKFIDLVIKNEEGRQGAPMRMVIECKRAARTEWIFLREQEPQDPHDDNRLSAVGRVLAVAQSQHRVFNDWVGVPFIPGTPQVGFCVIRSNGQRSQNLLETTAAELVRATDALAVHEDALHTHQQPDAHGQYPTISRVYIPVIVTTARLFVCDAHYDEVDLETGHVDPSRIKEVEAVRFKKSFGSLAPERLNLTTVADFAEAAQRTVLVVRTTNLDKLLDRWDFGNLNRELKDALWPKR